MSALQDGPSPAADGAPGIAVPPPTPPARQPDTQSPAGPVESGFEVAAGGFSGTLQELVAAAQRGEIDLATIPVAEITSAFRSRAASGAPPDARSVAEFLDLASRLLVLKAHRLLPEGSLEMPPEPPEDVAEQDDAGARLAEYRLFRAASEALLTEAAEQGVRSFLGIVAADVVPSERLSIPPERLAAALRRVLERIVEADPLPVELVTFSVPEKVAALHQLLAVRRRLSFEQLFEGVTSRLEAVAVFLALLELVKMGGVYVGQDATFGEITVSVAAGP